MFYRIVLQGHVAHGVTLSDVKQQFARVTGLPPSVTDRLFGTTPNVIKRQVPQADAERIVTTLRAIGASVTLEPDFQGPAAGGLDPVTVPAIPSFRHIELPLEPQVAAEPPPAWRRQARKLGKFAVPAAGIALLAAAALYFAPEVEELVRGLRKPASLAVAAPARKAATEPAAARDTPTLNASLLHGPWRCTNQNDGSSTYWNYRADGTLAYLGDDFGAATSRSSGPTFPRAGRSTRAGCVSKRRPARCGKSPSTGCR
ncbi:MAG: hypothetical protein IPM22_10775 [Betaproteobacteria bacterium]|nr:hypothetical protein [Betaproteobacteria bacterium]